MKKLHSVKNVLTAVLAVLCATLLCVGVTLAVGVNGGKAASAATFTNNVTVGELTNNGYDTTDATKKDFNGKNLSKLFALLIGNTTDSGATYDDVYKKIYGDGSVTVSSSGAKTYAKSYVKYGNSSAYIPAYRSAKQIHDDLANQNIVVNFGGQEWTVTFVTADQNGDLVATLWLKDRLGGNSWINYTGAHGWANTTNGGNQTSPYPGDMYTTSEVRVKTLNNGGQIATNGSTVGGAVAQDPSHILANFTMDKTTTVGGASLTDYLVQPKNLDYQYVESFAYHYTEAGTSYTYNIHNEALYSPTHLDSNGNTVNGNSTTVYGSWYTNFNYTAGPAQNTNSGKTNYSDWGNDYVWLPSLSETGCVAYGSSVPACTGIWGTVSKSGGSIVTTGQCSSSGTVTAPAVTNWQSVADNTDGYTWLRSGTAKNAYNSKYLTASGAYNSTYSALRLAVRPALHLNLKSAAAAASVCAEPEIQVGSDKLTKTSIDWDDKDHTFNINFDTKTTAITKIERLGVGDASAATLYTCTLPTTSTGTPGITPNADPNITCDVGSAASGATLKLKQAGKYTIYLSPIDKNYAETNRYLSWEKDGLRNDKKLEIYVFPKAFTMPEVATGDAQGQEYTGKDIVFTLASADTSAVGDWDKYMQIDGTCPTDLTECVYQASDFSDTSHAGDVGKRNGSFKASKVGEYKFNIKLKDAVNTVWKDENGKTTWFVDTTGTEPVYHWSGAKPGSSDEIKLEVTARTLSTALTNSNNWNWSMGKDGVVIKVVIKNFADKAHIDNSGSAPSLTGSATCLGLNFYYTNADGSGKTNIATDKIKATFDPTAGEVSFDGGTTKVVTGTLTVEVTMPKINTTNDTANPNYVFGVEPSSTGDMSKNYKVSSNSATKNFTVGTAVIDLDALSWTYNEDGVGAMTTDDTNPSNPITNKTVLAQNGHVTYKKNAQGTAGVEYEPQLMLYKETVSDDGNGGQEVTVDYEYNDASSPVLKIENYSSNGGSVKKASSVNLDSNGNVIFYKTTVKVKLVDTNGYSLKATGNPSHVRVNTTDNTAEIDFTWYIDRAKVDLSKVEYEYGWIDDTTGEVKWEGTYSDKSKPSFRDSNVSIRVKSGVNGSAYPDGITNAVINSSDYLTDRDAPGAVTAKVNYTLDPNYYYEDDNGTKYTGSFTANGGIELAKKKIPVSWVLDTLKDANGNEVLDDNGLPYQIYVLDFGSDPDNLAQYIKYEYYYADVSDPSNPVVDTLIPAGSSGTTTNAQLDYLIDVDGAGRFPAGGGTSTVAKPIFVRAVIDATVTGSDKYELNVAPGTQAEQYTKFGQKKNLVEVDVIKSEIEYGTAIANSDEVFTVKKGTATYSKAMYTAKIYAGTDDTTAVDVSTFDFSQANAGKYTVKLTLKPSAADSDALNKTSFEIEITAKEIELPQIVSKIEFNSSDIVFAERLDAKYQEYLDAGIIAPVSGMTTARDVAQSPYAAVIEIVNPNYKWKTPTTATPSKAIVKAVAADDEVTTNVAVDAASKEATYSWNIAPYRLPADLLNTTGKNGATINAAKLPEWARQLITDGTLSAGVKYYVDETCTEEVPVDENGNYILEKKKSYYAKPVIGAGETGDDSGNFTFATDGTITNTPAKAVTYKIPQSGAAAAFGSIKDFMTKTWMGLPIWAWFLIGLAVLILLIIIIVVAAKRRKTKEEREEKKAAKQAAKEEAEARKEAERARLESEREAERMRLESQREIEKMRAEAEAAKAKAEAEAEIAKMRAQAQAQMAQPMAMPQQMPQQMPMQQQYAQQPQMQQYAQQQAMPQQMPQPVPQPQYVQQPVNNNELEEIKKQLRKLNAKVSRGQGFGGQQFAAPVQMPMMPMQMPMSAQAYPQYPYGGQGDGLTELKSELAAMRAEQHATRDAEIKAGQDLINAKMQTEFTKLRVPGYISQSAPNSHDGAISPAQFVQAAQQTGAPQTGIPAETVVAMLNAVMNGKMPAEKPQYEPVQVIEAETLPVTQPAVYPPDAVITTTTTVDTTKTVAKGAAENERGNRETFFDIDGFYDKYEGK